MRKLILLALVMGCATPNTTNVQDSSSIAIKERNLDGWVVRIEIPRDSTICYRTQGISCVYNPNYFRRPE